MAQYKLFLNDKEVDRKTLERVESIVVEQEVDKAWEARVEFTLCLNERGEWSTEDAVFFEPFTRVRVEARAGSEPFYPLIDGPVVDADTRMSFTPGESTAVAVVQDDSVFLNRDEAPRGFEGLLDHQVAGVLFDIRELPRLEIEPTRAALNADAAAVFGCGTRMDLLRRLAERQGKHAYVLPGAEPGQSIGLFREFPDTLDGHLEPLVLVGAGRNAQQLDVSLSMQNPAVVSVATVSIKDKQVLASQKGPRERKLLGDKPILSPKPGAPLQPQRAEVRRGQGRLPRLLGDTVNLDDAAEARADRLEYAFELSGSIIEGFYPSVLTPYRVVQVRAGESPLSGNYVIVQVTHTLGRSTYMQSFRLRRNAGTETGKKGLANPSRSIA